MGPLSGVRVLEFGGIGPGPFCAMMLSDMGAEVLRLDRKTPAGWTGAEVGILRQERWSVTNRGRRSAALDLKHPGGREAALRLVARADALIEGFRPGVMERLGIGPAECHARNPALVYGRMTGYGQTGPLAQSAGHDINYLALSGALSTAARPGEPPLAPPTSLGDMGGGAMFLAFGVVCALLEARKSGKGQMVDASIVEGSALLTALLHAWMAGGLWSDRAGMNLLDGGAPFYGTYACADGGYVAVGALEPQFYAELLEKCGLSEPRFREQMDAGMWPELRERLAAVFRTRPRDEWAALFAGSDACVTPVLGLSDAPRHPHNLARGVFAEREGLTQPAPAPRFSRTPGEIQGPPPLAGEHTDAALADWGFSEAEIARLRKSGVI